MDMDRGDDELHNKAPAMGQRTRDEEAARARSERAARQGMAAGRPDLAAHPDTPMKQFAMWVVRDNNGYLWRYANGKPVAYDKLRDAKRCALGLDQRRDWKAVKATLTVL